MMNVLQKIMTNKGEVLLSLVLLTVIYGWLLTAHMAHPWL